MKVNIDVQVLCCDPTEYRGIPYYTKELIGSLIKRGKHRYSVSFFDYGRERGNRNYVENGLKDVTDRLEVLECNTLNYREVIEGTRKNDASSYAHIPYQDYVKSDADVFFFPDGTRLPWNIPYGKSVVTIHDVIPMVEGDANNLSEDFKSRFRNSMQFIAKREDILILTDSEYSKQDIVTYMHVNPERIHVIPAASNAELYYKDENKAVLDKWGIQQPYLLYLGALDPRKGIDTFIECLQEVKSNIQIVVAGKETPEMNIEELISATSFKDRIVLTGYVTDEEKRALLSQAEVFVFPSRYEGFGLPVLEAMMCETPVITTTASSLPEVGGDAVRYIEAGNAGQLAKEIDMLLSDETLRKELVRKGTEQCKRFSWNETAEKAEGIFETVFAGLQGQA